MELIPYIVELLPLMSLKHSMKFTKIKVMSFGIAALAFVFSVAGTQTAQAASLPMACPLSGGSDTTIVEFGGDLIFGIRGKDQTPLQSANIPAGKYKVTMVAFDYHVGANGHGGQNQNEEQYHVQLFNGNDHFQNVGTTVDIPENQNSVTTVATVSRIMATNKIIKNNSEIDIIKDVTKLNAHHEWIRGNYESVIPICVSFKKIEEPVVALEGSCSVSKTSIKEGESVTYTAQAAGGNGSYMYQWLDDVSGTSKSVTKQFNTAGTYSGRVKISDMKGQSLTVGCNNVVVTDTPVPPTPTLTVGCKVSTGAVRVNEQVTFTANAISSHGLATTYAWSGDVSGTNKTQSRSFATEGKYYATITAKDTHGNVATANCAPVVVTKDTPPPTPNPTVSCSVSDSSIYEGDTVQFTADAYNGTAPYSYEWTGDINGTRSVETMRFNQRGTYYATVTVTDANGKIDSADCTPIVVREEDDNDDDDDDLDVSCDVSDRRVKVGDTVRFTADVDGGDRPYDYDWRGDISGNDRSESVRFNRPGRYDVRLRVEDDNGNREDDDCPSVLVEDDGDVLGASIITSNPTGQVESVFLSQVPYTGPEDVAKGILYGIGLLAWSAAVTVFFMKRRNKKLQSMRIQAFKESNMNA